LGVALIVQNKDALVPVVLVTLSAPLTVLALIDALLPLPAFCAVRPFDFVALAVASFELAPFVVGDFQGRAALFATAFGLSGGLAAAAFAAAFCACSAAFHCASHAAACAGLAARLALLSTTIRVRLCFRARKYPSLKESSAQGMSVEGQEDAYWILL
jgi:hypothetical protein